MCVAKEPNYHDAFAINATVPEHETHPAKCKLGNNFLLLL